MVSYHTNRADGHNVWIVVFSKRHSSDFWTLFTLHRKNFDHCFCMRYDSYAAAWILVDWSSYGLYSEYITKKDAADLMAIAGMQGMKVLKITSKQYKNYPLFAFYCVTAVKHLVGIKSWAVTPYQLYCALKKNGATEIF